MRYIGNIVLKVIHVRMMSRASAWRSCLVTDRDGGMMCSDSQATRDAGGRCLLGPLRWELWIAVTELLGPAVNSPPPKPSCALSAQSWPSGPTHGPKAVVTSDSTSWPTSACLRAHHRTRDRSR